MTASLNKLAANVGSLRRQEVWNEKKNKEDHQACKKCFILLFSKSVWKAGAQTGGAGVQ